jgi:hypothetical protein
MARLVPKLALGEMPQHFSRRLVMLGISVASAKRYWIYARSWLYGKVQGR